MTDADQYSGHVMTGPDRIQWLKDWAHRYPSLRTFIETGTADAETVVGVSEMFDRCATVDIDQERYEHHVFPRLRRNRKIDLYVGDSAQMLPTMIASFNQPTMYWLDAHFCGGARGDVDTPVLDELNAIFDVGHVNIVHVDDARLFGVDPAYPTIEEVAELADAAGYDTVVDAGVITLLHRDLPEPRT